MVVPAIVVRGTVVVVVVVVVVVMTVTRVGTTVWRNDAAAQGEKSGNEQHDGPKGGGKFHRGKGLL